MRYEEVIVFTCGLMKDPSSLIDYVYNMFNEFNLQYIRDWNKPLHEQTEKRLNVLGKTTINLDFFQLLYSESKVSLPGAPLQNKYCNWFQHDRIDMVSGNKPSVYLPSQHFEFRDLKQRVSCPNIKNISKHKDRQPCSILVQNPDPDVADDLISICCAVTEHQPVNNLWLEKLNCTSKITEDAIRLSSEAKTLIVDNCLLPSTILKKLLQQLSAATNLEALHMINVNLGDYAQLIVNAIKSWEFDSQMQALVLNNCSIPEDVWCQLCTNLCLLKHITHLVCSQNNISNAGGLLADAMSKLEKLEVLYLDNCVLSEDQCCQIIQSLSKCKQLTHLILSGNKVGNAGEYLAKSIQKWGTDPPLQYLYLANCSIPEEHCSTILQSLHSCARLTELKMAGNNIGAAGNILAESIDQWGEHPQLQKIDINGCGIPEAQCGRIIQSLSKCKQLTHLNLSENKVGNAGEYLAKTIQQWGTDPPLQYLYLDNCSIPEEHCSTILQSLHSCTHLTELSMAGNNIGAAGNILAESINQWGEHPQLREIDIYGCGIQEAQCGQIIQSLSKCKQLTHLNLSENKVRNAGEYLAKTIQHLGTDPPLQYLYLPDCSIPQEQCSAILQSLHSCNHLTELNMAGNNIGAAGNILAESINQWGEHPQLRKIDISGCGIPEAQCGQIIQSLSKCKQLTHLNLSENKVRNAGEYLAKTIQQWGTDPPLQYLYLDNCSIPEEHCSTILQSLHSCTHLTELSMAGNNIGAAGNILAESINQWGEHPQLRKIYINGCGIPVPQCGQIIQSLSTCKQLTHLGLSGNKVGNAGEYLAKTIQQLGTDPPLQYLYLADCSIPQEQCSAIFQSLHSCTHLTELSMGGNNIGAAGNILAESINQWGEHPQLREIDIYGPGIPEAQCGQIIQSLSKCKQLTHLNLSGNKVGNAGEYLAKTIQKWGMNPSLQYLYLLNCSIPEEHCSTFLQSLHSCNHLTELSMAGNNIGAAGNILAESINQWGEHPQLQKIDISGCGIPEAQCKQIIQSLSKCKQLTYLNLSGNKVGTAGKDLAITVRQWGMNLPLQYLYLLNCSIPEEHCSTILQSLHSCNHLTELNMAGNNIGAAGNILAESINQWGEHPQLQEIDINGCGIPEAQCGQIIQSLSKCKQLTHLNLSENKVRNAGEYLAKTIQQWGTDPPLQYLYLDNCSIPEEHCSTILQSLYSCTRLTEMSMAGNNIGAAGNILAESINQWGEHPQLWKINIYGCGIPEPQCGQIIQSLSTCKQFTHLGLSGNKVGNAGEYLAKTIQQWGTDPPLQYLYLDNCSIPEEHCSTILQSLHSCTRLTELSMAGNNIGAAGNILAESINQWGEHPQLRKIDINGCGIPEAQCGQIIQSLSTCKQLTHLGLSGNKVGNAGEYLAKTIQQLGTDPPLQYLYLADCSIPQEQCSAIFQSLHSCTHLTELSMGGNNIGAAGNILAECINQWGEHPQLWKININGCGIPEAQCGQIIQSLSTCKQLTHLGLSGNKVGNAGEYLAKTIQQWGTDPPLQYLYLDNCSIPEEHCSTILQSLHSCTRLTELSMAGNNIAAAGNILAESINQWGEHPQLREIDIYGCGIPEAQCGQIIQSLSKCKQLTHLNLSGNKVGNAGEYLAKTIQKWGMNLSLQYLYLLNCSIPQEHCSTFLQSLHSCNHLTELSMAGNNIGAAGNILAESINQWGEHPQLQKIDISGCGIPEAQCKQIIQSLSKCKQLTYLNLSGNKVGTAGKDLAITVRQWGMNLPLQYLYLLNCSIPEEHCSTFLQSLHSCNHLTELSMAGNNIGAAGNILAESINQWGEHPQLQKIDISGCGIPEAQCKQIIQSLLKCKQLTYLNLSGNKVGTAGKDLAITVRQWGMNLPLQYLYLLNCSIPEEHCSTILQSLHSCNHLTELNMAGNNIGAAGNILAESINQRGEHPQLQEIDINGCGIPEAQCGQIIQSLSKCKQLTHLNLSENKVRNAGEYLAKTIQQWGTDPPLQYLYLDNCSIPEEHCSTILQSLHSCTRLTELSMAGNNIGAAGNILAESINQWGEHPQLRKIDINGCGIPEPQCGQIIQSLSTCKQFTHLGLSGNKVGNAGEYLAKTIQQLGTDPPLQYLYLADCSIPQEQCLAILQSLHSCTRLTELSMGGNNIGAAGNILAECINQWGEHPQLWKININGCGIPEAQCGQIIQSLSTCKQLTHLGLSGNKLGNAGEYLAKTIQQWGTDPPLQYLYLDNCSIPEEHCSTILQSLHSCTRLTELSMAGKL